MAYYWSCFKKSKIMIAKLAILMNFVPITAGNALMGRTVTFFFYLVIY